MSVKDLVKMLLPVKWRRKLRERTVSMSVKQLHGPKKIKLSSNEAAVTCLVKNGEYYMESFISHYTEMGFRHIFFLDNGSTDQTIAIAKRHKNVSVCQSTLPVSIYQGMFKKYLALNCLEGGWCLDADIDEFFDYPYSDIVSLREFFDYLNRKHFTSVITQLLDMFSDKPVYHLAQKQTDDLKWTYTYYDISEVKKQEYAASDLVDRYGHENKISNGQTALYFGGIRKTLYGLDCLLTKHSLFFPEKRMELFSHVHFVNNARLADVSGVMLHYKLTSNALEIAQQNTEGFTALSDRYASFIDFVVQKPDYLLKQNTAIKYDTARELVKCGFLFVSEEYREYAKGFDRK